MAERERNEQGFEIQNDPYNYMARVVLNRWKPYLLRAIWFCEKQGIAHNFARFPKQLPITEKVLSQNLKALMADGLVRRVVIPEIPPSVVYELTDRGRSLMPILDRIYDWGWHDMMDKQLPIDALGEMWHGYREPDKARMDSPYKEQS